MPRSDTSSHEQLVTYMTDQNSSGNLKQSAYFSFPRKGLTLIELLVVVAIIAVLAGIALFSYTDAQIRAKHAKVKADLYTTAAAIQTYRIDANLYPVDIVGEDGVAPGANDYWYISNAITTPVAYMTNNTLIDPFREDKSYLPRRYFRPRYVNYSLMTMNLEKELLSEKVKPAYQKGSRYYGIFRLSVSGPDGKAGPWDPVSSWNSNGGYTHFPGVLVLYDPTNGSRSIGDIVRGQAAPDPVQAPY